MKIIKPSVEIVMPNQIDDVLKHIERCARTCYKSEDKVTEDSAKKLVANLVKSGHMAAVEHFRFIAKVPYAYYRTLSQSNFKFLTFTDYDERYIISGNARAFLEALYDNPISIVKAVALNSIIRTFVRTYNCNELFNKEKDENNVETLALEDLSEKEFLEHGWYTVKFVCDRGVSHEIVRHRDASYCQESTRYCNYNKGKFGNEITVIKPCFWKEDEEGYNLWEKTQRYTEEMYRQLINSGATPQQARSVLTNSLKTEVIMTATVKEHLHFDELRCSKAAHPQMREVALEKLAKEREVANKFGTFENLYNEYEKEILSAVADN